MDQRKVNLFIVGAMKAGTTSFNEFLASHPMIYFSPIKEPNYFVQYLPERIYKPSRYFSIERYFEKQFPNKLHIAKVDSEEFYNRLFSQATDNQIYLAEGSTSYFHAPESAKLIYEYNPNAKIIILLRDPIKRAFSHFKMDLAKGRTKKNFEEEIGRQIYLYEQNKLTGWSYLAMSIYSDAIKRFVNYFGKNVLVLISEDIFAGNSEAIQRLEQFLSLKSNNAVFPKSNSSIELRFQKIFYYAKQSGLEDLFRYTMPIKIRHKILSLFTKKEAITLVLSERTYSKFVEISEKDKNCYNKFIR